MLKKNILSSIKINHKDPFKQSFYLFGMLILNKKIQTVINIRL